VSIHILGYGTITRRLSQYLSPEFEVFLYSDLQPADQFPLLSYSELSGKTFGNQDTIVLGWRGIPTKGSSKMDTLNLLSKHLTNNQKLINLSSVSVYGNTLIPADENQKPAPSNSYGETKRALEQYCDRSLRSKVRHLRISNVFGDVGFDDVLNRILRSQKDHKILSITNPRGISRDFISIDTLVNVVKAVVTDERNFPNNEVLNISSGKSITLYQLLEIVKTISALTLNYEEIPIPEDAIYSSLISNEKIRKYYSDFQFNEVDNLQNYISNYMQVN
jgi:nucleoside-diphosphate-sugar epimerase